MWRGQPCPRLSPTRSRGGEPSTRAPLSAGTETTTAATARPPVPTAAQAPRRDGGQESGLHWRYIRAILPPGGPREESPRRSPPHRAARRRAPRRLPHRGAPRPAEGIARGGTTGTANREAVRRNRAPAASDRRPPAPPPLPAPRGVFALPPPPSGGAEGQRPPRAPPGPAPPPARVGGDGLRGGRPSGPSFPSPAPPPPGSGWLRRAASRSPPPSLLIFIFILF